MKISLKSEESFTVVGPTGMTLASLKKVGPEWNGMTELRTPHGEVLIVVPAHSVISRLFDSFLSQSPDEESWTVVSGSPDLISQLQGLSK